MSVRVISVAEANRLYPRRGRKPKTSKKPAKAYPNRHIVRIVTGEIGESIGDHLMSLVQLSHFKRWLLRGPTDEEWERVWRTLSGMHWSARISYHGRIPVAVEWIDRGHEQASLCMLPLPEPSIFGYSDDRFLRACGISIDKES
jgi:hypothetical protein